MSGDVPLRQNFWRIRCVLKNEELPINFGGDVRNILYLKSISERGHQIRLEYFGLFCFRSRLSIADLAAHD